VNRDFSLSLMLMSSPRKRIPGGMHFDMRERIAFGSGSEQTKGKTEHERAEWNVPWQRKRSQPQPTRATSLKICPACQITSIAILPNRTQ
jgi:hypothetical protein